jgi:hypothetical protein
LASSATWIPKLWSHIPGCQPVKSAEYEGLTIFDLVQQCNVPLHFTRLRVVCRDECFDVQILYMRQALVERGKFVEVGGK